MGCVCGKGDRRSSPVNRRGSERASVTVTVSSGAVVSGNVVRLGKERARAETEKNRRHTGDFGPPERRRPHSESQQGWPSWLMAVAGDAIRDWTPRRANTFEKLDKVNKKNSNSVKLFFFNYLLLISNYFVNVINYLFNYSVLP